MDGLFMCPVGKNPESQSVCLEMLSIMGHWKLSHAVSVSAIVLSLMSIICFNICPTSAKWQGDLSAYELASFNNPDREDVPRAQTFNHFTLSDHGDVYVGAVNWLYRLNSRLEQIQNASTCNDSMPYNGMPCRRTSNYNKILVVDSTRPNGLITCGGAFDGICQLRQLQDINDVSGESVRYVAGFSHSTTVTLVPHTRYAHKTIYIAVTYTAENINARGAFPALTRRNIESNPILAASEESGVIFLSDAAKRNHFAIKYVSAFDFSGFTYFIATQRDDLNSAHHVSKINRVCQTSSNLDAYTEITIQCSGSDGSVYSLVQAAHFGPAGPALAASLGLLADEQVLYAVFAKNQGAPGASDVPTNYSALCVYRMTDILAGFTEAVQGCIQDGDDYKISYLQGSACNMFQGILPDEFLCDPVADGTIQLYKYAKGTTPVSSAALLEVPGSLMSSIITSVELNHTVAFIGTSRGKLLKVHIKSNTTARMYERVPLDTSPVLTDVKINDATREMHVLTEQKLIKMRAENCDQYKTCETCIGTDAGNDGDPYCGWCTLERKCSRYSDCDSPTVSTRWLAYNAAQCINITDVAPYDSLPITVTEQQIVLSVQQLPALATGQSYECYFGSYRSPATKTGDMLTCRSPPSDGIPAVQQGDDAVGVDVSVFSTETMVRFIDIKFHFYSCSVHASCISCVASRWACDWCVFDNKCTHESSTCPEANEIIIIGKNNPVSTTPKGPGSCPQLQAQSGEVLLPNGIQRSITVRTENLPDPAQISSYRCILEVEGMLQKADAEHQGSSITCEQKAYTYLANNEPELEVRLTVTWTDKTGAAHILDDVYGFNVTIYKCEVQKPDCSRCVTARPELGCLWCDSMPALSVCKLNETCTGNVVTSFNGVNCPDPVLSEVFPLAGPIEGSTVLTVIGTDIGRRFGDVMAVMVGSQPCDLDGLSSDYVIGGSVSCRTKPEREGSQLVTLTITGADGTLQHSSGVVNFKYTNPRITSFEPRLGPEAGGTAVSVYGTDLNTGRNIAAFIGEKPCIISSVPREEVLECTSSDGQAGMQSNLRISFDGANRASDEKFSYTENPVITRVQPLKSIYSGGRTLNVNGQHLDTCRNRQIYVGNSHLTYRGKCTGDSPTEMQCKSPNITSLRMMMESDENLTFGFIMDGVIELLAWSENNEVELEYFEDPVYVPFENGEMEKDGSTLTIMGERLDSAITAKEIQVRIGKDFCEVNLVSDTVLQCTLPKNEPAAGDFRGGNVEEGLPVVWVLHNNLEFVLGRLIYPRSVPVAATVAGVLVSFSVVTLLVAVLSYLRQLHRKRTHDQRLLNRIMEVHLEMSSNVKRRWWQRVQKQMDEAPTQTRIVLRNKVSYVPDELHIEFRQLELGKTLGQGAFGRVLQAVLHSEAGDQIVAVKTVQDTSDPKNVVKFLEEGLIMKTFDHVNVLGLVGLAFDSDKNPLVVLPFMANGDLQTFLVKNRKELPTSQLIRFASDVALGMAYLAQHKFVHRDLAARNCMVDSDLLVKIADFGLSRDMQESDYYTSGDAQAKLPIKWMAPECMERRKYNSRTDVWSYGVLLWEIFSLGEKPYPGLANRDVYDFLKDGQRMIAPNNCPPEIYGIMQRCWQDNPKSRCTFQQVANLLESLLSEDNDYTALTGAGRAGENQAEPPEHPNESYLVPKQMETAFGVEGPWNVDKGAGGSGVPPAHDRSNYVNKAVTR